MIRNPPCIASRISPELSSLIESIINNLDTEEPITLGVIHIFATYELPDELNETEYLHHADTDESLIGELDALIEEHGGQQRRLILYMPLPANRFRG